MGDSLLDISSGSILAASKLRSCEILSQTLPRKDPLHNSFLFSILEEWPPDLTFQTGAKLKHAAL